MLRHKNIIFQIKRGSMRNVYLTAQENLDLLDNLTPNEVKLYTLLKYSVLANPTPDYFEDTSLAHNLGLATSSIKKMKSILKKKGYALIVKMKDEKGYPLIRVVVGKDQVTLYNLGLNVEISDAKTYRDICENFDILNPKHSDASRKQRVADANAWYREQLK